MAALDQEQADAANIMLVNFTDQGRKGFKDVPHRQEKTGETAKQFGVERKTVPLSLQGARVAHARQHSLRLYLFLEANGGLRWSAK